MGLKVQSSHICFQIAEVKVIKLPGQDPCSSEEDLRPWYLRAHTHAREYIPEYPAESIT